jgi:hypothetical protein
MALLTEYRVHHEVCHQRFSRFGKTRPLWEAIKGLNMVAVNRSKVHEYRFDIKTPDRVVTRGVPVLAVNRSAALNELRQIRPGCIVLADIAPIAEEPRQIPQFLLKRQP